MPQENKQDAACMHVHTSFDTYSDRHVLGVLLCAGVIALCRAVLCFARGSTTAYVLVHTTAVLLLLYTGTAYLKRPPNNGKCRLLYKMLVDVHTGSRRLSVCLLALSSDMYPGTKEEAYQSTAQHGTAGHSTARYDTARHRTALRRAVELAR